MNARRAEAASESSLAASATPYDFAAAVELARTSGVVRERRLGRWATGVVIVAIVAFAFYSISTNKAIQWRVVGHYFFEKTVMRGLLETLWLTFLVTALGFIFGTILAAMRLSSNPVLPVISWFYVWIFRSTPLLVQLIFWFNIGYLYPKISFGIPFGPTFVSTDARNLISATAAAILGLTMHEVAYACEVVRGGILSVDVGQTEAAKVLGLQQTTILRRIVLPQAMRAIIPAAANLLIGTLKGTAIVSTIAVAELLYSVQLIYDRTYQIVPLLVVATVWYIIVTSLLSIGQYYLERHFSRSDNREATRSPWWRFGRDRVGSPLDSAMPGERMGGAL